MENTFETQIRGTTHSLLSIIHTHAYIQERVSSSDHHA